VREYTEQGIAQGHPYYDACATFCELYDQPSFDPAFDTDSLESFRPLVCLLSVIIPPLSTLLSYTITNIIYNTITVIYTIIKYHPYYHNTTTIYTIIIYHH
jgi:hypothetical protein